MQFSNSIKRYANEIDVKMASSKFWKSRAKSVDSFFLHLQKQLPRVRLTRMVWKMEPRNGGGTRRAFKAISARISLSDTNNPMGQQDGPFRIRRRINEGPAIPGGCYLIPVDLLILRLVLGKAQCGFHVALDYPYFFAGLEGPAEIFAPRRCANIPTWCLFQPRSKYFILDHVFVPRKLTFQWNVFPTIY